MSVLKIKRVFADRPYWRGEDQKNYHQRSITFNGKSGIMTIVSIRKIDTPWTCSWDGECYCIADVGYRWLSYFLDQEKFVLTCVFDSNGNIVHRYVDICVQLSVVEDQTPYFDDLFLDIVVLPNGKSALLDEDELQQAAAQGLITDGQYRNALMEGKRILRDIEQDRFSLLRRAEEDFRVVSSVV